MTTLSLEVLPVLTLLMAAEVNDSDPDDINKCRNNFLTYSIEFDSALDQVQVFGFDFDFKGSTADENDVIFDQISFFGDGKEENEGIILE